MRTRTIRDIRGLHSELERQQRQGRRALEEDVVIETPRRLFVRSPDGHYWQVTVSDLGVLTTTDVGTTLP